MASRLRFRQSNRKREIETRCHLSRLLVSETRHVKTGGITHRFWATYRKVLDKNRLDLMASRLRIRQSNRKREIETRCHLSRLLVSETRHVKMGPKTVSKTQGKKQDSIFLENVWPKTRLDFSCSQRLVQKLTLRDYTIRKVFSGRR